uniref:Sphingosine kinase 2-like isoform X2 n=2 Tax=Hirondellea gigas TaxID=1518452 RepID=A0A6A7FZ42_9CRUS
MTIPKLDFGYTDWFLEDSLTVHKSRREVQIWKIKVNKDGMSFNTLQEHNGTNSAKSGTGAQRTLSEKYIKAKDVIGCSHQRSSRNNSSSAFMTIYAYPVVGSKRQSRRKRQTICFEFKKEEEFQKNLNIACVWEKAIHHMMDSGRILAFSEDMSREGKLLVLINPQAGPGKAYLIFRKQVVPVLSETGAVYDVIITQHSNHAYELVQNLALDQYRAIAVVAGDGLLYEVFNGLGRRDDWEEALSIPVCIIPGGSGNGLARSLAYWRNEPVENGSNGVALNSALNLARGTPYPMDLVMIHTSSGQRIFSFLSFGLGILSDIDIESERLRILGESRFTLWAFARIAALRKYNVTVSFKRAAHAVSPPERFYPATRPAYNRSQTLQEETFSTPPQFPGKRASVPAASDLLPPCSQRERQQHRQLNHSLSYDDHQTRGDSHNSMDSDVSDSSISLGPYPSPDRVVETEMNPQGTSLSHKKTAVSSHKTCLKSNETLKDKNVEEENCDTGNSADGKICGSTDDALSKTNNMNCNSSSLPTTNATTPDGLSTNNVNNKTDSGDASTCMRNTSDSKEGLSDTDVNDARQEPKYEDARSTMPVSSRRKKTSTRKGDYSHMPQFQDGNSSDCEKDDAAVDENQRNEQQCGYNKLSQPVPDDWEVIKDEFIMVFASHQSHISSSVFFAPNATPDDGCMWLMILQGSMTRANVAKFLMSMDSGTHCTVPGAMMIPVTGVRIEPHDPTGLMTVDGETIPFGAIEANIMPSHARIMVR